MDRDYKIIFSELSDESEMNVLILSDIYARRDQKNAIAESLNQLN